MKITNPNCPECGQRARGTLEVLYGRAEMYEVASKPLTYEYRGWTEVFWDAQKTVERDGKKVLLCPDGHEWLMEGSDE